MERWHLFDWATLLITSLVAFIVVFTIRWLLLGRHPEQTAEQRLPRQLSMLAITVVAIIAIVLALPVSESSRNQVLGLIGVLLSGMIAFSSTTIVSNLMAGVVLRMNKPFRTGDYIRCHGFAGRVTEKGLLDTEIQTEQRTLIHIANNFLITHPVDVVRTSGTIINAEASIGYDVHHTVVEKHLINAANNIGLTDVFVHITELGNFSVNYKVSGLLADTKSILTTRSKLHAQILDQLHLNNIEIMSPTIMAPRAAEADYRFIPTPIRSKPEQENTNTTTQESVVFDKADKAESEEQIQQQLQEKIVKLNSALSDAKEPEKATLKAKLEKTQARLATMILQAKTGSKE